MHPHNLLHLDPPDSPCTSDSATSSGFQTDSDALPVPQTGSDSSSAIQTDLYLPTVPHTDSDTTSSPQTQVVTLYLNEVHARHARMCSLNFSLGYTHITLGKHGCPPAPHTDLAVSLHISQA